MRGNTIPPPFEVRFYGPGQFYRVMEKFGGLGCLYEATKKGPTGPDNPGCKGKLANDTQQLPFRDGP